MSIYAWLYAFEVALVVAAIPGAWWIKREGDKSWRAHQRRQVRLGMLAAGARIGSVMVTITPVFGQMVAAAAKAEAEMQKLAAAFNRNDGGAR